MNSKIILLLGAILSSIVVLLCLKNQYHLENKKQPIKQIIKQNPIPAKVNKEEKIVKKIKYKKPTLLFKNPNYLEANISSADKEIFANIFQDKNISKNINYLNDINKSNWLSFIKNSLVYFHENNISDGYIKADGNLIEINATFTKQEPYQNFKKFLSSQNELSIKDKTSLKIKPAHRNTIEKKVKEQIKKQNVKVDKIQNKINKILKSKPIYFKFDSDVITLKGRKTLEKVLKILNNSKISYKIMIKGHTNAVGNEKYNKILSQKRANSVKKYLLKHSKKIKSIIAKGYGSQKPFTKNPKDKRNRRVEIIIEKGQQQ